MLALGGLAATPASGFATAVAAKSTTLAPGTKVGEIRLLAPRRTAERGTLAAWVRVRHSAPRAGVDAGRLAGASNAIRLRFSVTGNRQTVSRTIERSLPLDGRKGDEAGYQIRIPARTATRLTGGAKRLRVTVRAIQTLDLDGDGSADGRRTASRSASLAPRSVAAVVSPADGFYTGPVARPGATTVGLLMRVSGGNITQVGAGAGPSCPTNIISTSTPIDPATGSFRIQAGTASLVIAADGVFGASSASISEGVLGYTTCGVARLSLGGVLLTRIAG